MKTARQRAVEIARKIFGPGMTPELFERVVVDDGDLGETVRKAVGVIEKGIEEDRRVLLAAGLPS